MKAIVALFVVATPVLGVWIASSLAAYSNHSVARTSAFGLVLFPILPLTWVIVADARRRRSKGGRPHILTFCDRLLLRTLAINVTFLVIVLGMWPERSFLALATRGDWMLEGRHGGAVESARRAILATAGRLEWLYLAVHHNPYQHNGAEPPPPPPSASTAPAPSSGAPPTSRESADASDDPTARQPPSTATDDVQARSNEPAEGIFWPTRAELHPLVVGMPADAEASITSVGRYIADHEADPFRRAKALHDYVADRVAYDVPAFEAVKQGGRVPQEDADAEAVFKNRKGVCAGYAELFVALAKAAGDEAVYIVGDVRDEHGGVTPYSHAWNAVKIRTAWYLLDVTWDAGGTSTRDGGQTFHKEYRTDYLFVPGAVMGLDHFPQQEGWQLRQTPLTRSDFVRQPLLQPAFVAQGLRLVQPDQPQLTTRGSLELIIENPHAVSLLVTSQLGEYGSEHCQVGMGPTHHVHCVLPAAGTYRVMVYSNKSPTGMHAYVGGVEANNSP